MNGAARSTRPAAAELPMLDARLWSTIESVVFFPVRHHSPTCARLVTQLIRELRPAAVLIEGPSDFNPRIAELLLDHEPPLAIYSYFTTADDERCGAFYPFSDFSPEWTALRTAHETGARFEFIDLPWANVAPLDRTANRYADGRLGRSSYTSDLCRRLGVDDWNALWDTLFEIDPALDVPTFLQRCHSFCFHARVADGGASAADHAREAHMLARVRAVANGLDGQVLVVTGGFHSSALFAGWRGIAFEPAATGLTTAGGDPDAAPIAERGLALTPYSYERLDELTGYDAGLPHPGFYHRVWLDRCADGSGAGSHRTLLGQAASAMRARGQIVSTADLIGVESFAQGLATLRGHATVWRTDLVDALLGTLVKDELATGGRHPFLDALNAVFRGDARGRLAPGTPLPPLVADIARTLAGYDLTPASQERTIEIDLEDARGRRRSQILHRVRILDLPGVARVAGTDFVGRGDLAKLWETWRLRWSPEFDAACIQRALYGASLLDAAGARLAEAAARIERDADAAARLLLDASLAGWSQGFALLHDRVVTLVRADASFPGVARALQHLYYLHRYDEFVTGAAQAEVAALLTECYVRATWLLESQTGAADHATVKGLRALLHAVLTAGDALAWDRTELLAVLQRIANAAETPPLLRGATAGALWSLGMGDLHDVLARLPVAPEALGDFLQGVFALAGARGVTTAQRTAAGYRSSAAPVRRGSVSRSAAVAAARVHVLHAAREGSSCPRAARRSRTARHGAAARTRRERRRGRPGARLRGPPVSRTRSARTARRTRSARPMNDPLRRKTRWRLVLGAGSESCLGSLSGQAAARDEALAYLYDREYGDGRNVRPGGPGSLDESQLTVPEWINDVHELFPRRTIERIEKDALERYQLQEMVTNPDLLARAQPSQTLLKAVLHTRHLMNAQVLALARQLVRRVVEQLMEKLAREVRQPFYGALDRRRRSLLKVAKNFDARTTLRRNLKNWQPQERRLVIDAPYFHSRVRRQTDRWQLILLVDESGSMMDSVIHAAVTAACFWHLRALKTHLVLFDTAIVDVTADCTDPVETLMKVQLGGGTDIGQALAYAHSLIENPRRTIVVLISDFFEGAPVDRLFGVARRLIADGATLLGLAALDAAAHPHYDENVARQLVNLGAHVGAMTPGELAEWVARKVG